MGAKVSGVTLVSNYAAKKGGEKITHESVSAASKEGGEKLVRILKEHIK
jgi:purine nucleoside phosphorylase